MFLLLGPQNLNVKRIDYVNIAVVPNDVQSFLIVFLIVSCEQIASGED